MLRSIPLLLATALLTSVTAAQEVPGLVIQPQNVAGAWFLAIGGGVGGHDNGPFSRRLQSYTPRTPDSERLLYRTGEFSNVGTSVNVSAGFQLAEDYFIGVSGELAFFPTVESVRAPGEPRDEYTLSGLGGGLDLGLPLIRQEDLLLVPFLHVGYYAHSLEYANNQAHPIPFFEGDPVPAGETATFSGAAPRLGVGLLLVSGFGADGLVTGIAPLFTVRLLYGRMIERPEWEEEGKVVTNGGLTPGYNALTLSFQIGLGSADPTGPHLE